jgi:hypothetical protein
MYGKGRPNGLIVGTALLGGLSGTTVDDPEVQIDFSSVSLAELIA